MHKINAIKNVTERKLRKAFSSNIK